MPQRKAVITIQMAASVPTISTTSSPGLVVIANPRCQSNIVTAAGPPTAARTSNAEIARSFGNEHSVAEPNSVETPSSSSQRKKEFAKTSG